MRPTKLKDLTEVHLMRTPFSGRFLRIQHQRQKNEFRQPTLMQLQVRSLVASDIYRLHKMYGSLSETSKRYFHPEFLGFGSINLNWLIFEMVTCLFTIRTLKEFLARVFQRSILSPMVAVNATHKEVVGFAYLILKERISGGQRSAGLGMVVRDDFQGMGIGSVLLRSLLAISKKENIGRLSLTVQTENHAATGLYEKFGFRELEVLKGKHVWKGKKYDAISMRLDFPER